MDNKAKASELFKLYAHSVVDEDIPNERKLYQNPVNKYMKLYLDEEHVVPFLVWALENDVIDYEKVMKDRINNNDQ